MDDNILSWNVGNWVSVTLMALISFFVIAWVLSYWQKRKGGSDATN